MNQQKTQQMLAQELAFGPHLMLDLQKCDPNTLSDQSLVYDILCNLPTKVGMTKMTLPYVCKWMDKFGTKEGISGFVMIAESHISIHTFPDQDYVFIDLFSCRGFDIEKAITMLKNAFGAQVMHQNLVMRGPGFDRGAA